MYTHIDGQSELTGKKGFRRTRQALVPTVQYECTYAYLAPTRFIPTGKIHTHLSKYLLYVGMHTWGLKYRLNLPRSTQYA